MNIVYKASDPLDEFYRICDEQGEERRLEARRKIYEEKDFNCVYCLYHEKRSGCMYRECPLTPDRVCCGCATIASAWRYMAIEMNHEKLLKRINKYIYSCRWRKENMMIFINEHDRVCRAKRSVSTSNSIISCLTAVTLFLIQPITNGLVILLMNDAVNIIVIGNKGTVCVVL